MEEGRSQINSRSIGNEQIAGKLAERSGLANGDSKFRASIWLAQFSNSKVVIPIGHFKSAHLELLASLAKAKVIAVWFVKLWSLRC
jgi:hypothetical protein